MARTSDLDRVAMIVLRFMRGPIFLLIAVYAVGITGMAIIPGREVDGEITYMSFFHALYFMTYTATTTGFGELPGEFSDAQRMWAIACLYMSVVAWFYSIGTIIRLMQNPHFRQALAQYRFSIGVKRIADPFVIICGFGDTGSLLARGLSDHFITGVLIDIDEERIKALNLRDYRIKMPGLCGDASVPKQLLDAGLQHANCQAVVALTSDEDANLKIAVMTRILNPQARIICRSSSRSHIEELRMLGSISILDPFETFARQLCTALHSPALHTLDEWLIGAPGVTLDRVLGYPVGTWIVCGYGRMGRWLCESLQARGVPTVVISPDIPEQGIPDSWIRAYANKQTLEQAGAGGVAGVIAATNSDSANLRIVLMARALNPEVFLVVRQNRHENEVAFAAARTDLIMQPSLVTARRILLRLISPSISLFLDHLQAQDTDYLEEIFRRLRGTIGDDAPLLWMIEIDARQTPAVTMLQNEGIGVALADSIRDPAARERQLDCIPLVLERAGQNQLLPVAATLLQPDDQILLCGTRHARRLLEATLNNVYTLQYLVTGQDRSRSYLLKWLRTRQPLRLLQKTQQESAEKAYLR